MQEAIKRINSWIALNDPTKELDLSHLNLEKLPPIPQSCQKIYCYSNKLTSLPELPNCKKEFACDDNLLKSLPTSLANCEIISCNWNFLTSLPELPKCKWLFCCHNELTFLPTLPNCKVLWCRDEADSSLYMTTNCQEKYGTNKYLYLHKKIANYLETPNYNKCAQIIQRNYKKYLRAKYQIILNSFLFAGPSKIVCLYTI